MNLPNVEVVALLVVLGESFCNDLVLELMLDLELFKLDMPFRSALNILRLFLGATALDGVEEWFPFPARESFSDWSSLLFFLRFFVRSLIFVNVVPLESWLLLADEGFEGVAATDLLDPCKLFLKIMKFTWNFWLSKKLI